jgi:hypothetical protein
MRREEFLYSVQKYIESDPEAAAHVANFVQAGLKKSLDESRERAADMEAALSVLAHKRYKGKDEIIKQKLSKWRGKTSLCWDWLTNT